MIRASYLFALILLIPMSSIGQAFPFSCDGSVYLKQGSLTGPGMQAICRVDTQTWEFDTIATSTSLVFNILAYNYQDNFIYSIEQNTHQLLRVNSIGDIDSLGVIQGIDTQLTMIAGDFDSNGIMFVSDGYDPKLYKIDVGLSPPLVIDTLYKHFDTLSGYPVFFDFSYNRIDGLFYSISNQSIRCTIEPTSGLCSYGIPIVSGLLYGVGATFFGIGHQHLFARGPWDEPNPTMIRHDIAMIQSVYYQLEDSTWSTDGCSCNPICANEQFFRLDTGCSVIGYPFGEDLLLVSGTYSKHFLNSAGCDSLVHLDLFMNMGDTITIDTIVCDEEVFSWNQIQISSPGSYFVNIPNGQDCYNRHELNVTYDSVQVGITSSNDTLQASSNGSYSYVWIECETLDSLFTSDSSTFVPGDTMLYAVVATNGWCSDTSECRRVVLAGVASTQMLEIHVFPNPTTNVIIIDAKKEGSISGHLKNAFGSKVLAIHSLGIPLDVSHLAPGIYYLELFIDSQTYISKLVKI